MKVLEVNEQSFNEEVLNSPKPVIIDFFATWCEPCMQQSPIIEEIADIEEEVKVVKIDVDKNAELADKYDIMSIPTILIIKDGQVIKDFVGLTSKDEILEALK